MGDRTVRAGLALALAIPATALAIGQGAVAHAATGVSVANQQLNVIAGAGDANNLTITLQNGHLVVADTTATLSASGGCLQDSSNVVRCPALGVVSVLVDAGDLNDLITYNAPNGVGSQLRLFGGPGNDRLELGPQAQSGRLFGGPGNDTLRGGPGNDLLDGGEGPDGFFGNAGVDTVDYSSRFGRVVADLDGAVNDDGEVSAADGTPTERDTIKTDVEGIIGGHGRDTLIGNAGANTLQGRDGIDELRGLDGDDVLTDSSTSGTEHGKLFGGAGNDILNGGDGDDDLDGGSGNDSLFGWGGLDSLRGGPGPSATTTDADTFSGGSSLDSIDYSDRPQHVEVFVDQLANDGYVGEGDRVQPDLEVIVGTDSDDLLVDRDPGGSHVFSARAGNDLIHIRDGGPGDQAWGDVGLLDSCVVDQGDLTSGCEGSVS